MLELTEVDYELILKSYSAQDVALEESEKQRLEHYRNYEEILQEHKRMKRDCLGTDEERQTLYAKFTEKLNIRNSFTQLQKIPNSKISAIQNEILDMYQGMSNDSDSYVNAVNNAVKKFQNLGTEFDESAILKNKARCIKKIEGLVEQVRDRQDKYNSIKHSNQENQYAVLIGNVNCFLNNQTEDSDAMKMKLEIANSEQHLSLLNKNIAFLKQRNQEFEAQCAAFN